MTTDGVPEAAAGPTEIGWPRAIACGIAIVVAAFLGIVYLPARLLEQLSGFGTTTRSLIVLTVSTFSLIVIATVLRRLQARRLI